MGAVRSARPSARGRTMRRWLLAGVGGVVLAAAAACGPRTPNALIARLGADRFADREAAGRELLAAGPGAIPLLEAAARSPNPEVARRAADLLAQLRRQADSLRLTAAPAVRLDYRSVPLAAALADLRAKTHIPLTLDPDAVADPLRPVTCAAGELPAWEAVAAFARAAGLRELFAADLEVPKTEASPGRGYYVPPPPRPGPDGVPVVLAAGPDRPLPGCRSGGVRVLALPADFPRNRASLARGEVTLHLDVTPVPGLHWRDGAAVRVTRVVDEFGREGAGGVAHEPAIGLPAPAVPGGLVVGRGVALRWDTEGRPVAPTSYPNPRAVPVPLRVATPHARSLRRLEGVVVGEVVVPGAELASVDRPAEAEGDPVEGAVGVRVVVLDCEPAGRGRAAVVRVRVEAPSPWLEARRRNPWGPLWPEPSRPAGLGHHLAGLDAAGKPVPAEAASVAQVSDDGHTLTTVWQLAYPLGVPDRLVLSGPKPTAVEVPFVLENVPLP